MKIHQYSLMKDVTAVQNKPRMPDTLWQVTAPVKLKTAFWKGTKVLQMYCKTCMLNVPWAGRLSDLLPGKEKCLSVGNDYE